MIINDQEYSFIFSFRAIKNYIEAKADKKVNGVKEMQLWIYFGLEAGAKKDKKEFDLSEDDVLDWMDDNMDDAIDLTKHCKDQFVKFRSAFEAKEEKKPTPQKMKKAV